MSASTMAGVSPTLKLFACASMAALANSSALAEGFGPHVRGLDSDDEPDGDAVTGDDDCAWLSSIVPEQWAGARKIKTPTEADNAAAVRALPRRIVSEAAAGIRAFWERLLNSNDSWEERDGDGDGSEFVRDCRGKMKGGHRTAAWGRMCIASSPQLSSRLCEKLMAAFGQSAFGLAHPDWGTSDVLRAIFHVALIDRSIWEASKWTQACAQLSNHSLTHAVPTDSLPGFARRVAAYPKCFYGMLLSAMAVKGNPLTLEERCRISAIFTEECRRVVRATDALAVRGSDGRAVIFKVSTLGTWRCDPLKPGELAGLLEVETLPELSPSHLISALTEARTRQDGSSKESALTFALECLRRWRRDGRWLFHGQGIAMYLAGLEVAQVPCLALPCLDFARLGLARLGSA